MTDDIDIYRAANEYIKRYGNDATVLASMKADEMLERGSMEGRSMWLQIIRVIDELQSDKRPIGAEVH